MFALRHDWFCLKPLSSVRTRCFGFKPFLTFTYVKLFNLSSMLSNGSLSFTLLTTFLIRSLTDGKDNRYSLPLSSSGGVFRKLKCLSTTPLPPYNETSTFQMIPSFEAGWWSTIEVTSFAGWGWSSTVQMKATWGIRLKFHHSCDCDWSEGVSNRGVAFNALYLQQG